jgi:hypothetical protein
LKQEDKNDKDKSVIHRKAKIGHALCGCPLSCGEGTLIDCAVTCKKCIEMLEKMKSKRKKNQRINNG